LIAAGTTIRCIGVGSKKPCLHSPRSKALGKNKSDQALISKRNKKFKLKQKKKGYTYSDRELLRLFHQLMFQQCSLTLEMLNLSI
jgi:hypothetical protein